MYASVQQAFVFSKYKYGNPEVGVDFNGNSPGALLQGIDYSTYPSTKDIHFWLEYKLLTFKIEYHYEES